MPPLQHQLQAVHLPHHSPAGNGCNGCLDHAMQSSCAERASSSLKHVVCKSADTPPKLQPAGYAATRIFASIKPTLWRPHLVIVTARSDHMLPSSCCPVCLTKKEEQYLQQHCCFVRSVWRNSRQNAWGMRRACAGVSFRVGKDLRVSADSSWDIILQLQLNVKIEQQVLSSACFWLHGGTILMVCFHRKAEASNMN